MVGVVGGGVVMGLLGVVFGEVNGVVWMVALGEVDRGGFGAGAGAFAGWLRVGVVRWGGIRGVVPLGKDGFE